jgi:hypothetical protein
MAVEDKIGLMPHDIRLIPGNAATVRHGDRLRKPVRRPLPVGGEGLPLQYLLPPATENSATNILHLLFIEVNIFSKFVFVAAFFWKCLGTIDSIMISMLPFSMVFRQTLL